MTGNWEGGGQKGLDSNPGHSGEDSFIVDIQIWVKAAFIDISGSTGHLRNWLHVTAEHSSFIFALVVVICQPLNWALNPQTPPASSTYCARMRSRQQQTDRTVWCLWQHFVVITAKTFLWWARYFICSKIWMFVVQTKYVITIVLLLAQMKWKHLGIVNVGRPSMHNGCVWAKDVQVWTCSC